MEQLSKLAKRQAKAILSVKNSLCVMLQSVGNPDFRQYAPISPPVILPVDTLKEAAEECQKYIDKWELGSGNWTGGDVYHPIKGKIATISYNCRVWKGDFYNDTNCPEYTEEERNKTWKEL